MNGSGGDSEALKSAEQGVERGGLGGGSWGGGEGKEGVEVFGKIEKRASTEYVPFSLSEDCHMGILSIPN